MNRLSRRTRRYRLIRAIKKTQGLIGYWPLNEVSGDSLNNAPGTLGVGNGTVTSLTQGVTGKLGRAYSFDGANSKIDCTTNVAFQVTGNYSVLALMNPTGLGESSIGTILFRNASSLGIQVRFASSNRINVINDTTQATTSTNIYTLGANAFMGMSYNGATASVYINGVLSSAPATAQNPGVISTSLVLGNASNQSATFNGLLQHIALFNRALTLSEQRKLAHIAGFI